MNNLNRYLLKVTKTLWMKKYRCKWIVLCYSFFIFSFMLTIFLMFITGFHEESTAGSIPTLPLTLLPTAASSSPQFHQQLIVNLTASTNSDMMMSNRSAEIPVVIKKNLWVDEDKGEDNNDGNNEDNVYSTAPKDINPALLTDLLPHLKRREYRNLTNLNARILAKAPNLIRSPPEFVLMVPSKQRNEHDYLLDTLKNLVESIAAEERHMVQIVVMLSEDPWDQQMETKIVEGAKKIITKFGREIMEGLIEVIAAPKEWFPPNLEHIQPTLGDPPERMRWRTKQNLDYAFAMMHVHLERPNARYYLQLEDDILTLPHFISEISRFANAHPKFFLMEFSNLGFIGRMFKNNDDLMNMAQFILLLHKSIPVDWVLSNVLHAKFCSLDDTWKACLKKHIENIVIFRRNPPLFQHVGKHSSLPGKVQKLTEKNFAKNSQIQLEKSGNPPADEFKCIPACPNGTNGGDKLRSLYDANSPFPMDDFIGREEQLEIGYNPQQPLARLRGLRIFFSVQFHSAAASLASLPSSFLHVHINHSCNCNSSSQMRTTTGEESTTFGQSNNDGANGNGSTFFLLIPDVPLVNVSSIQIGLNPGDWQQQTRNFTLTSIKVIS